MGLSDKGVPPLPIMRGSVFQNSSDLWDPDGDMIIESAHFVNFSCSFRSGDSDRNLEN